MKPIPFHVVAQMLQRHHAFQHLVMGFAIDTRKICQGDLFFALPGNRVDGQKFLAEAVARGAIGAVIREDFQGDCSILPVIKVPDVLLALQDFARQVLKKRPSKVIAITGSLGKTTTKEFVASLLSSQYKIFASPLSYNSQATVPLSILMADGTEDYLILEMGMTHPGDLSQLISIAPPDMAIMTTVAVQHASNFSDGLKGISREKAAIFSHSKTSLGLLHHDLDDLDQMLACGICPKKTFSTHSKSADYFLQRTDQKLTLHVKNERTHSFKLHLPNQVHDHNFVAAAALAHSLNIPWKLIQERAPLLKLPSMRFERVEKQGILFVNDAYNANPDSMNGALENLPKPMQGGQVVAVLSEMDALGSYSEEGHVQVGKKALLHVDHLLCIGKRCAAIELIWNQANKPCTLFESYHSLEIALKKLVKPGDVVLLKGARSYALDQLLNLF